LQHTDLEFSVASGSSEEMLFACLDSLHSAMRYATSCKWSVTVSCQDPSDQVFAARVRSQFPLVRIIASDPTPDNLNGHSRVLGRSRARYVWLLNDDVVFLAGAIEKITTFMDRPENARVALVGPQMLNPDGLPAPSGYAFPSMRQILLEQAGAGRLSEAGASRRHGLPQVLPLAPRVRVRAADRATEVDTLPSACFAVRMRAIRQTGLMNDQEALDGAEKEWHRRFKDNGWKVVLLSDASVIDYGIQSARTGSGHIQPEKLRAAVYFFRTGPRPAMFRIFCASILAITGARAAIGWVRRDRSDVQAAGRHARVAWEGLTQRKPEQQI